MVFQARETFGMIAGCQRGRAYWTPTNSPGFVQGPRSRGYSEIRRPGLSGWSGVKKNGVWLVWDSALGFLRSEGATHTRPVVRGDAYASGGGGPQGSVSPVRQGEAGKVSLAGEQPVLHEAVCLVCGTTLPGNDSQGGGAGTQVRLEDRKEAGQGVYAGAAQTYGDSWPQGHRY